MISQPAAERPMERCRTQGPHCLSLRECLALILGPAESVSENPDGLALASLILERTGTNLSSSDEEQAFFTAAEASPASLLSDLPGLEDIHKARLQVALELGWRYSRFREKSRLSVTQARRSLQGAPELAIDRIPAHLRGEFKEWIGFVPLYRNGNLGDFCLVERGVRTHVNLDPGELFARVLALRPQGFFLFHNHPSGSLQPSIQDMELTRQIKRVAGQLGLRLLGHGIITSLEERWIVI